MPNIIVENCFSSTKNLIVDNFQKRAYHSFKKFDKTMKILKLAGFLTLSVIGIFLFEFISKLMGVVALALIGMIVFEFVSELRWKRYLWKSRLSKDLPVNTNQLVKNEKNLNYKELSSQTESLKKLLKINN